MRRSLREAQQAKPAATDPNRWPPQPQPPTQSFVPIPAKPSATYIVVGALGVLSLASLAALLGITGCGTKAEPVAQPVTQPAVVAPQPPPPPRPAAPVPKPEVKAIVIETKPVGPTSAEAIQLLEIEQKNLDRLKADLALVKEEQLRERQNLKAQFDKDLEELKKARFEAAGDLMISKTTGKFLDDAKATATLRPFWDKETKLNADAVAEFKAQEARYNPQFEALNAKIEKQKARVERAEVVRDEAEKRESSSQ